VGLKKAHFAELGHFFVLKRFIWQCLRCSFGGKSHDVIQIRTFKPFSSSIRASCLLFKFRTITLKT